MVMTGRGSRRLPPAIAAAGLGLVMMLAPSVAGGVTSITKGPDEFQVDQIDRELRPVVKRALLAIEAERMIDAEKYEEGIERYREAIDLGAEHLYEDLAMAYYYAEDFRGAAKAFLEAFEHDDDEDMLYNAACCASLGGKNGLAIEYLERAIRAGYSDADHMGGDSDLESIRGTDAFADLAQLADTIKDIEVTADEAVSKEDWATAHRGYAKLAEMMPGNGNHVHMAAFSAIMGRDMQAGREWLDTQLEMDHNTATAKYNYACLESLAGNESDAMEWLGAAIDDGFSQLQLIRNDSDLDAIRDRDGFDELLAKAQRPERMRREMELAADFEDWDAVVEKAEALVDMPGTNDWAVSQAKRMLARAHEHNGDHDKAIKLAIESASEGYNTHDAMVTIARNYAMAGDDSEGAIYLAAAIEMGAHIDRHDDDALDALEDQPAVRAAKLRQQQREELSMFDAVSWEHLAEMGREQLADEANHGWDGHLQLGWAMLRMERYDDAVAEFTKLYESGTKTLGAYNVACAYSLDGNEDQAFAWLAKAMDAGFYNYDQYADDPDLVPLHDDPRWDELLAKLQGSGSSDAHDHDEWDDADEDWDDEDEGDWDADDDLDEI